jgi:TolB-like protein/DNA-binding winged helix-turn-helix (wHTH) protein
MDTETTSLAGPKPVNAPEDTPRPQGRFRFGVFEVDLSRGELRKQGSKIKLQEKPFQLLVLLLERAGTTTTREELRRGLWPVGTFVGFDANLKTAVNKLRQALGDSAENPIFIETIPRQGYRFLAPVVQVESDSIAFENERAVNATSPAMDPTTSAIVTEVSRRSWETRIIAVTLLAALIATIAYVVRRTRGPAPIAAARDAVLLVLPFDNLSGDPKQEYFGDGLTDEMITLLSSQYPKGLAVIARTSAMRYRGTQKPFQQISRELGGVDYILEGTVRRSGNHVGINAQLIRAQDQSTLWAQTYENELGDLMVVQRDVAQRIARSLALEVLPGAGSPPAAQAYVPAPKIHDAYLMGLYEANKRSEASLRKSIEYFRVAIEGDPSYAPAYAGLANSYLLSAGWEIVKPEDAYPNAKAAALRAIELNENLAEAHASLASVENEYEWKWDEAEREYHRALNLDPNSVMAHKDYAEFLMHSGRNSEAIFEIERARELDPLSLIVNTLVGFAYHISRREDRAIEEYRKVLELDPKFAPAHYFLGGSLLQTGHFDEAIAHLQSARTLTGGASVMSIGLARAYAMAGHRDLAQRTLDELKSRPGSPYVSPYGLAQVYAALGDKTGALEMLHLAATERSFELMYLKADRTFDKLREDGDFQKIVKQIGFPA